MGVSFLEPSGFGSGQGGICSSRARRGIAGERVKEAAGPRQAFRLSGDLRGAIFRTSSHFRLWELNRGACSSSEETSPEEGHGRLEGDQEISEVNRSPHSEVAIFKAG